MDAKEIISKINVMMKDMLNKYYDKITNDLINKIHENENVSIETLKNYAVELKDTIVNFENVQNDDIPKQTKVIPVPKENIPSNTELEKMKRRQLQAYCKIYKISGRQKNTELIKQLIQVREKTEKKSEVEQKWDPKFFENDSDNENDNDNGNGNENDNGNGNGNEELHEEVYSDDEENIE